MQQQQLLSDMDDTHTCEYIYTWQCRGKYRRFVNGCMQGEMMAHYYYHYYYYNQTYKRLDTHTHTSNNNTKEDEKLVGNQASTRHGFDRAHGNIYIIDIKRKERQ